MLKVQQNDKVTITFVGKLENGAIFLTVTEEEPTIITIGNSDIPPTLERALIGMSVGEQKIVRIEPDEGYGPRRKDLLQTLNRNTFNAKMIPQVGMILSLKVEKEGHEHQVPATIVEINNDTLVVDYNHPLAGHNLIYNLTVLAIEKMK
jgi:FKBP-type peptidyl-prolyl cis-trans isomerase 2